MNGKELRNIRENILNLTQAKLGEEVGRSRESIISYEKAEEDSIPSNVEKQVLALIDVQRPDGDLTVVSRSSRSSDRELVPYFEVDFAAGNNVVMMDAQMSKPDYYMDIPEFSGCTAFRAYSNSMENKIKSGSILFGTKVENWRRHLEYGQIYGIICNDGRRYLKYIRKFKENPKQFFLLRSENETYDDFEMPIDDIRSIWLIHGWLLKRT